MSLLLHRALRQTTRSQFPVPQLLLQSTRHYASPAATYKKLPGTTHPETIKSVAYGTPAPKPAQDFAVNPPESTLPPPLEVPSQKPGQWKLRYLMNVGKSYLTFYKTALKAILQNYKQSNQIASRIPRRTSDGKPLTFELAAKSGLLTRADFQFILRSRRDVKKLPLVGLMLLICGEFTPLVVVFVAGLIPRPAWIPKQVRRSRTKIEERRKMSFRQGTLDLSKPLKEIAHSHGVEVLSNAQILHVSRALGLHSTFWETFWDRPPQWLARRKVLRAFDYLEADDQALRRDGGVKALLDEELRMACEERGIDVRKVEVETLRKQLKEYLRLRIRHQVNVGAMVLVRPNQYDQLAEEKSEKGLV